MAFGFCALFLAVAGLYGVMSFSATQRTREMGIRVALGAQAWQLIRFIMRKGVIQLGLGFNLGLALALLATNSVQPLLYEVHPRDPVVLTTVLLGLAAAGLLASFLPARRVTKIDPVVALVAE